MAETTSDYRHPLLGDDEDTYTYTFAENGYEIRHAHTKEVSRTKFGEHTYITASDFKVYAEFPLYNALTGKYHRMWLTPEQVQNYRAYDIQRDHLEPDPRLFELHKVGVLDTHVERQKASKQKKAVEEDEIEEIENPDKRAFIEAYTSPGCVMSIVVDNDGNYWHGSTDRASVRPYTAMVHGRPEWVLSGPTFDYPELRFMFPHLSFLGPAEGQEIEGELGKGFWYRDRWGRREDIRRLTLCTYEVRKVIEELGVWDHYFPVGASQIDPDVARKEAQAVRDHLIGPVLEEAQRLAGDANSLREAVDIKRQEVADLQTEIIDLKRSNEELQSRNAELEQENALLQKRRQRPRSFDPLWDGDGAKG